MLVSDTLIAYFNDQMSLSVTEDTPLIDEGIIDSMGVVDLIDYVSEKYQIEFDGDDMTAENLQSISALASLIESKK